MTAGFLSTRAIRHRDGNGKVSGMENREVSGMESVQSTATGAGQSSQYSPDPAQADLNIKKGG
jgi:hypothetical protein